jgi:hypothetical protein
MNYHDNGNEEATEALLEAAPQWRRSTYCANGACVEVAARPDAVLVRDGKLVDDSPRLAFDPAAWRRFVDGIRAGDFEERPC